MSESFRITQTENISCPSSGTIEIIMLKSYMQNSQATIYEGTDATGRRIWDIATLANDSSITPILNIPYSGGIYVNLSGTGAGLSVTVR